MSAAVVVISQPLSFIIYVQIALFNSGLSPCGQNEQLAVIAAPSVSHS